MCLNDKYKLHPTYVSTKIGYSGKYPKCSITPAPATSSEPASKNISKRSLDTRLHNFGKSHETPINRENYKYQIKHNRQCKEHHINPKDEYSSEKLRYSKKRSAKAITKATTKRLLSIDSPLHKSYLRSHLCNEYLLNDNGKLKATYCKNKHCKVCSRIRSLKAVIGYKDAISKYKDLYYVVLTSKNVIGSRLSDEIDKMEHTYTRIKDNARKRKIGYIGLMTEECTYNHITKEYNPHINLILTSKEAAEYTVTEWLKRMPKANRKAQKIRKVENEQGALMEILKYISKDITGGIYIPEVLDKIYISYSGRRTLRAFGKIKRKKIDNEIEELNQLEKQLTEWKKLKSQRYKWNEEYINWVDAKNDTILNNKLPNKVINTLKIINTIPPASAKINVEAIYKKHRKIKNKEYQF